MRRSWMLLLACSLGGAALAQSDRQFQAGREADLNQWRWAQAQRNRTLTEGEKAVQAVSAAMGRSDCVAAASALNAGLAKSHPEVWLLAGAMFEDGLCLKANWDRALNFYQRADGAGLPSAAARLAAGYATAAGGRDLAASLWWAARAKTALPAARAAGG
jgi:TPR repeat protein